MAAPEKEAQGTARCLEARSSPSQGAELTGQIGQVTQVLFSLFNDMN